MTNSYQGHDGEEPEEPQLQTNPSEANSNRRVSVQQSQRPLVIYTHCPKPIHVEAHDFKNVVQRLTGKDWYQNDGAQQPSDVQLTQPSHSSRQSQEALKGSTAPQQVSYASPHYALEEYLDRLDKENPSPNQASNPGLFPTAGLVKGVDLELGLRWGPVPSSASSSSRPSESSTLESPECKEKADDKYINCKLGIQFSKRCACRDTSAAF